MTQRHSLLDNRFLNGGQSGMLTFSWMVRRFMVAQFGRTFSAPTGRIANTQKKGILWECLIFKVNPGGGEGIRTPGTLRFI